MSDQDKSHSSPSSQRSDTPNPNPAAGPRVSPLNPGIVSSAPVPPSHTGSDPQLVNRAKESDRENQRVVQGDEVPDPLVRHKPDDPKQVKSDLEASQALAAAQKLKDEEKATRVAKANVDDPQSEANRKRMLKLTAERDALLQTGTPVPEALRTELLALEKEAKGTV